MVMKRSTVIKKALKSTSNTVCVNEEQVEVMLKIFEKLGMFYCPIEDLGEFGKLRTPKGWESEDA
jgi:ssDNA-specific exonuclease RecJ